MIVAEVINYILVEKRKQRQDALRDGVPEHPCGRPSSKRTKTYLTRVTELDTETGSPNGPSIEEWRAEDRVCSNYSCQKRISTLAYRSSGLQKNLMLLYCSISCSHKGDWAYCVCGDCSPMGKDGKPNMVGFPGMSGENADEMGDRIQVKNGICKNCYA